MTTTTRRKPVPDLSYLKDNPAYKENPGYVSAAVEVGGLVTCSHPQCKRVVGLGTGRESAIESGLRLGTAVRVGNVIRCPDHAAG